MKIQVKVSDATPTARVAPSGDIVNVGGGTALPAVSKEDEGKVLQVKDGKWVKQQLPPFDESFSDKSVNAVQNRVVAAKITEIEATIGNIDALLGTL